MALHEEATTRRHSCLPTLPEYMELRTRIFRDPSSFLDMTLSPYPNPTASLAEVYYSASFAWVEYYYLSSS